MMLLSACYDSVKFENASIELEATPLQYIMILQQI